MKAASQITVTQWLPKDTFQRYLNFANEVNLVIQDWNSIIFFWGGEIVWLQCGYKIKFLGPKGWHT